MIKYSYPLLVVTFISIVCNSQTVAMIKPIRETIYVGVDTRQGQVSYNDKTKKYDTISFPMSLASKPLFWTVNPSL